MGFQTAFICESDLVLVQVQIGFVFDTALAFVFDGNVQLLFAAFEFQIGIVVFDFRLNHMKTFAARVDDHFFGQGRNGIALAGKFGFVFKFAVALMIGFDGVRAIRTVDFGRQRGGECRGGEKSQNAGGQ